MRTLAKLFGIGGAKLDKVEPKDGVKDNQDCAIVPPYTPVQPGGVAASQLSQDPYMMTPSSIVEKISEQAVSGDHKALDANCSDANGIEQVSPERILPNPFQPRKTFNAESLQELSQSIAEFGVIQPLLVRRRNEAFELIAGERRLRASRLAGLASVPVIVKDIDDKEMAELAMIENLQREDLHYLEEAEGFHQLLINFGFTQDELAKRVGKNQSTIANKMRLLKLPTEVRQVLVAESLTERHARSLLKLEDGASQLRILQDVCQKGLNVRQTEELIAEHLACAARRQQPSVKQNFVKIIKDVRIFVNTVNSVVSQMRKSGLDINVKQEVEGEFVNIQIQVRNSRHRESKRASE